MTEAARLQLLRTASDVRQILARDFDFSPCASANASPLFHLDNEKRFELFGRDKSGGEFALCGDDLTTRCVLFVSSEGQAGVVGRDLEHFLSIIIAIPYWMDCLKFSGGGQLLEMRLVASLCESDLLTDRPDIESSRRILKSRLEIQFAKDPILALHEAVSELSSRFPVLAGDGSQFSSLFGRFTASSNPAWRKKLN